METTTTTVPKYEPPKKKRQILSLRKMRGYILKLGDERVGPERCDVDVPIETALKNIHKFEDRAAIRKAAGVPDPNASYARQREGRAQQARAARDEERAAIGVAVADALAEHLKPAKR